MDVLLQLILPYCKGGVYMKACGVIVEYNPYHNGHVHHIKETKKVSQADCIIAVMSGPFLQRGEPAIIDKFARAKAALESSVDIVMELPYLFAVQNSDIFAQGAVEILHKMGVSSICFGSESGRIENFKESYQLLQKNKKVYEQRLKEHLNKGLSFPEASKLAYRSIGLSGETDLAKPNNILGFSYIKAIYDNQLPIEPLTIQRISNQFHETDIRGNIASATSIRKQLIENNKLTEEAIQALPTESISALKNYKLYSGDWHHWELYFPFLHYRVMTMKESELGEILGVDEGIEYRIKKFARKATSMYDWIRLIKTKRYTWTRIQRMFVHILTNTKKQDVQHILEENSAPPLRILGFTEKGRSYLKQLRKENGPKLIFSLNTSLDPSLENDVRAARAYYSVFPPSIRNKLFRQELQPPIQV